MFGLKQKRDENLDKLDFKIGEAKRADLSMNRESKWDETLPPFDVDSLLGTRVQEANRVENKPQDTVAPTQPAQELKPMNNDFLEERQEREVKEDMLRDRVEREELEELSNRIENENKNINRRFKSITKNANQLSLESQELIDLIRLYANTTGKFSQFIEEMNKLEARGWKFDQNVAALYKFRVGMALASMKKQNANVEKICKKIGFTPANIKTILNSPIEALVDSLNGRSIEEKRFKK